MKKIFYKGRFFFIPLGIASSLALISFIVMALWNNLLPDIINVSTITFWQAMGIFILSKILFGFGRGGHKDGPHWMKHKCGNMTPEERERFKAEMKNRLCFSRKEHFGDSEEQHNI
ncbi:MAG: hypothetical protein H7Y13_01330 [Sphingobacteriaceae bacterium]|nr:hypothetical protein [Sphingobacteriaceae bacterium]